MDWGRNGIAEQASAALASPQGCRPTSLNRIKSSEDTIRAGQRLRVGGRSRHDHGPIATRWGRLSTFSPFLPEGARPLRLSRQPTELPPAFRGTPVP
jgi:hypothetical protein